MTCTFTMHLRLILVNTEKLYDIFLVQIKEELHNSLIIYLDQEDEAKCYGEPFFHSSKLPITGREKNDWHHRMVFFINPFYDPHHEAITRGWLFLCMELTGLVLVGILWCFLALFLGRTISKMVKTNTGWSKGLLLLFASYITGFIMLVWLIT